MSSKRGRKRNDNLPPNRARDVQRAFRQRRSEHLRAMEERVSELEEENDRLRAALNMPPANRVPLGKGPTGKDKPKPYKNAVTGLSRATSADSGVSTRATSISPTSHANSLQTSPQSLETGQWIGGNADDVKSELSPGQNNNNNNNHGGGGGSGPFAQQSSLPSSFPNSSTGTPTYAQSPVSPSFAQSSTPNTPYGQQSAGPFSMSSSAAQKAPSPWAQLSSSSRSNLSSGAVYLPQSYTSGADSPGGMNNYPRSYLDPNTAYHPSASMTTPSHDPNAMHGGGGNPHPASLQALVHPPPSGAASTMASNLSFAPPARRQVDGAQAFRPLPNHQLFISSQPQHLSSLPPPRDEASAARNA